MDDDTAPIIYDANSNQYTVEPADTGDQSPTEFNTETVQVVAVPLYGINTRIENLNSSIDDYVEDRQPMKAKRCLKRIEVWEQVKTTFQTEVLPEDSLTGGRTPFTPTNEDSVDAVLIPRVWLEDKIEDKQEERDTCVRKEHMDWADYYRVQREAYEKYLLKRNAEFTVQKSMLDESVVETVEDIE